MVAAVGLPVAEQAVKQAEANLRVAEAELLVWLQPLHWYGMTPLLKLWVDAVFAFGTDAGVFPHGLNAREFAYLVENGMTPLEAIRALEPDVLVKGGDWPVERIAGAAGPDGNRYEGRYEQGKKQGHGKFIWRDGRVYDGEWSNGLKHGTGMLRLGMSGRRRRRVSSSPSMPGRPMSMMAASNDSLRSTSSARSPLPTQSTA